MAPMIDMVFLLLVFFMTVSTLAQDARIPLALAESERSEVPEETEHRGTISLQFGPDREIEYYAGAERVASLRDLHALLTEELRKNPELEANLRAPADMPFKEIKAVLKTCAEAGAYKVVYATYQKS